MLKPFRVNSSIAINNSLGTDAVLVANAAGVAQVVSGSSSDIVLGNGTTTPIETFYPSQPAIVVISTATHTASSSTNKRKRISMQPTTGNTTTVTIPTDASDSGWAIGDWFEVYATLNASSGAMTLTISPESGVTIQSPDQMTRARTSFSVVYCEKVAANTWLLAGDLGYA